MIIGNQIEALREQNSWTQAELARKLGVHVQTVGRWERGQSLPDAADIVHLAKLFKVTSDHLLFEGAPPDGRIDIPDLELLILFEDLCALDQAPRDLVKEFLKAFVLRETVKQHM